jgi:hypothetical protein
MHGAIYDPPQPTLPRIAVIFHDDGRVAAARECCSVEDGERMIKDLLRELQASSQEKKN